MYTNIQKLYTKISNEKLILNPTWQRNNSVNRQLILSSMSLESLVTTFTAKFDFSIDGVVPWKKCDDQIIPAIDWLSNAYPDVTYSKISKYFSPIVVRKDLSVNHCQVNIMRYILNNHHNLANCNSILEIGAGYGAFAREILLTNNKIKYVIIDLSESIMCSYSYLNLEFPNKSHVLVTEPSDLNKDFDILYIPVLFLKEFIDSKKIVNFDLFINTCSLGEMNNDTVNYYYNLVTNTLKIKSVYWLNRFLDNGTQTKNSNACMVNIPKNWHIKHWKRLPKYLQCPYIIPYHAKYTEIYADIKNEEDGLNSNINSTDKLFNLWNTNRLNPSIESLESIIEEIEKILPTSVELFYYREQLTKLKQ